MKALEKRIDKREFIKYLEAQRKINKVCLDVYTASHNTLDLANYEDFITEPTHILEKAFFSDIELDYIYWYLYEDVEKKIYDNDTKSVIAELNTDEDLWDYLNSKYIVNAKIKKKTEKKAKKSDWNWLSWMDE